MDSIPKFLASIITIIIALLLCVSLIFCVVVVSSARTYHSSVIEQIEASNFEEATIQKCISAAASDNYTLAIERTTTADSDPYSFYKVTLNYNLSAPLFGNIHTGEIVGYALGGARVERPSTGDAAQGTVPGLYETGSNYTKLLIPWNELVEDGVVSVNDGVVGTGYTSGDNASSAILAGDLLMPFDGSVTDIEEDGFFLCEELTGVKIPDSVKTIGNSGFAGCYSLKEVYLGARLETVNSNAFNYDGKITDVYYNGSVEDWCNLSFGNMYSNPLLPGADLHCYGKLVENVTVPEGVTSIKNKFSGCKSLTSVTIPDGTLTEVPASAFARCSNLTSVKIGEGVKSIGNSAFLECYNLETVYIPASVTTIGTNNVFYACESIQKIVVADGNTKYHDVNDACLIETATNTLLFGTAIDGVAVIPEGVVTLESYAFGYNSNIKTVVLPASLTTMYYDVFEGCSNLTYVSVADGNTTFHSVDNCIIRTASKSLVLGSKNSVIPTDGSVKTIGSSAFCGLSITSMVIPEGITSLGATVFCYCFELKEVTLPASLTSFSNNLFLYCESLTDIHYGGTMEQWKAISFPSSWDVHTGDYVIHCTDGDIPKVSS